MFFHCGTAEGFIPGETFLVEMYESDFDDDANDVVQATDRKLLIGVTERFFEERDVSTAEVGCFVLVLNLPSCLLSASF